MKRVLCFLVFPCFVLAWCLYTSAKKPAFVEMGSQRTIAGYYKWVEVNPPGLGLPLRMRKFLCFLPPDRAYEGEWKPDGNCEVTRERYEVHSDHLDIYSSPPEWQWSEEGLDPFNPPYPEDRVDTSFRIVNNGRAIKSIVDLGPYGTSEGRPLRLIKPPASIMPILLAPKGGGADE